MQSPPILEKVIQSAVFFQIQISSLLVHFVGGSKQRYNKGDKPDFIPLPIIVDSICCHNLVSCLFSYCKGNEKIDLFFTFAAQSRELPLSNICGLFSCCLLLQAFKTK
jgi:hypothetical protein